MKTNLQAMRKRAGFNSAKDFAIFLDMNVATYTDYEQGRRGFTLDRAWEFADALHCTLDELAGREWPRPVFDDPRQEQINQLYESSDEPARASILDGAQNAHAASQGRKDAAPPAPETGIGVA